MFVLIIFLRLIFRLIFYQVHFVLLFHLLFWNDDGRYGLRASHARRWHFYAQEAAAERNDGAYGRAFDPVRDQYVCDGSAYRKLLG